MFSGRDIFAKIYNGELYTIKIIKKQKNTCLHKIKKLGDLIYINSTVINKKYQMLLTKKVEKVKKC